MHTTARPAPTAADLVDLLDLVEIRTNPFANVTGTDELGAPITDGTVTVPCENPF